MEHRPQSVRELALQFYQAQNQELPAVVTIYTHFDGWSLSEICVEVQEKIVMRLHRQLQRAEVVPNAPAPTHRLAFVMSFNGANIDVDPHWSPAELEERVKAKLQENREAYLASPEYAAKQARDKAEIAEKQSQLDALVQTLPDVLARKDTREILEWIINAQPLTDRTGVVRDVETMVGLFAQAGFQSNQWVRDEEVTQNTNPQKTFEYLVGQAIDTLQSNVKAIHPVVSYRAKEYLQQHCV